ncbi:unnamed protein product [Ranitomeya imitator]|uniref:Uncharacterized protein n=1 Tax=Ranitomeya imitator TaxID=111125 RepID=A0ABN9KXQ5_9NEOB|nr:unnamed protein product [Ranitomeya imitator]
MSTARSIGAMKFLQLFGRWRSIVIGMVHLKALPGSPGCTLPVGQVLEQACQEAEVYRKAGIVSNAWSCVIQDGLIVENMNDVPYTLRIGPRLQHPWPLSVPLSGRHAHDSLSVFRFSLAAISRPWRLHWRQVNISERRLDFIRAEGFVFSHVADEGLVHACAGDLLRYRKEIGAEHIQIFADIKKKHSSHAVTADVSISETARAAEFFLADGVILTGVATGQEADAAELKEVQRSVRIPALVGSGVTLDNVETYEEASAMIVGSHFKHGGDWRKER